MKTKTIANKPRVDPGLNAYKRFIAPDTIFKPGCFLDLRKQDTEIVLTWQKRGYVFKLGSRYVLTATGYAAATGKMFNAYSTLAIG